MKGIIKVVLFLLFFIGDIAFIFSFRGTNDDEKYNSCPNAVSHVITNEMSVNDEFIEADSIFNSFLQNFKIKGASIAVAKDGRLVMAKGYGYANVENNEKVEPRHIFRIASVSKLLTAIGIMKLQEEGKLSVDDKVFGPNGFINDTIYSTLIKDERIYDITIHNLLNHSGGWSKHRVDPMFNYHNISRSVKKPLPLTMDNIIEYVVSKKLDFTPGTKSSYSNFGYALLGKIIENVSGQTYAEYIKTNILYPLEIYDMHIARPYEYQRSINEVTYYDAVNYGQVMAYDGSGEYVPLYYGGNDMDLIAPTGGWLASPSELLKLVLAVDGFKSRPDILSEESIQAMVNIDNTKVPYGWKGVKKGFWYRTGTLRGTSALVVRQSNELCWVALFNTSPRNARRFPSYVNYNMNKMLTSIHHWPEYDLFDYQYSKNYSFFAEN